MSSNQIQGLQARVRTAAQMGTPLNIEGSGSKSFLGRIPAGASLNVTAHAGIVNYQPKELVITARCGTTLEEIEAALAEQGQMLPFEPPHFGSGATIGGTVACGLSGPARPYMGAARDLMLGARLLTGRGEVLRFGGEVMKNVAGYDVSRLMTGAYGTLGLLLDVSMKVLPVPASTLTLAREQSCAQAIELMNGWAARPLPITATCYDGERLYVRLAGAEKGVSQAQKDIGGEPLAEAEGLWRDRIREQGHEFFGGAGPLWRLSVPQSVPPIDLPGKQLIEWGGAQRWLRSDLDAEIIRAAAERAGGHASLFRGGERNGEVFHPLLPALMTLHRGLKRAFDPEGLFNPGRLYAEF